MEISHLTHPHNFLHVPHSLLTPHSHTPYTLSHPHTHTHTHYHTLIDKLLLFFTHGTTSPRDRLNRTIGEATPDTILSTITQRSAETGNNVVISVYYTEQDPSPFRTLFFDRLPMVRTACDMHTQFQQKRLSIVDMQCSHNSVCLREV